MLHILGSELCIKLTLKFQSWFEGKKNFLEPEDFGTSQYTTEGHCKYLLGPLLHLGQI